LVTALAAEAVLWVVGEVGDGMPVHLHAVWGAVAVPMWVLFPAVLAVWSWRGVRGGWSGRTVAGLIGGMFAAVVLGFVAVGAAWWVGATPAGWTWHALYAPLHLAALGAGCGIGALGLRLRPAP
jgi:hypothetical protein